MFNYCKKHYKCIYSDTGIPNTLDIAVKKGFNAEVIKVCRWSTESPLIGIEIGDIAIPFRRRLLKRHLREENKAKMSYMMMCQNLLLAALMMFCCSKESEGDQIPVLEEQPALAVVDGRATFTLSGTEYYVNVMGNTIPRMPVFPSLSTKPGIARGYVADLTGKPLKGAHIAVSSTMDGGWYSSGSALTDENGYYEFTIPAGAAYFFGTATTITYNETPTVVTLYPAGGKTSFPSGEGVVRNFTLLSYGPANPDEVAQQPNNESNYYGGALSFSFHINYKDDGYQVPEYLPEDGVIDMELIPIGSGLYGETKSFKISKQIGNTMVFII